MIAEVYSTPAEEHINTRTNVGVQDLSTMGKVDIKGPDAEDLANYILVNDIGNMVAGSVRYSSVCNENGRMLDDLTIFKMGDEHFRIVTGSINRQKMFQWITSHAADYRAYVTDLTAAVGMLTIQGPRSREFLKSVISNADLDNLKNFRFTQGRMGETQLIVSRTGVTGELGYELYVPADEASLLWQLIMQTGQEFDLAPYGIMAMYSLGLEKGYPAYGLDMDESRTPFHVGLDRFIKFNKESFIGRDALLSMRNEEISDRWVGLVVEGSKAAAFKDSIFSGKEKVGFITYSDTGHSVKKILAVGYVVTDYTDPGTELTININGVSTPAAVSHMPFFDPEGIRLKS